MPFSSGGSVINAGAQITDGIITDAKLVAATLQLRSMSSAWMFPAQRYSHSIFGDSGVTNLVFGYTDDPGKYAFWTSGTTFTVVDRTNGLISIHAGTTEFAAADNIFGAAIIGLYIYVGLVDQAVSYTFRVYRYLLSNIGAGGTLMTVSGTAFGTNTVGVYMNSDGTNLYLSYQGGNHATSIHIISKYSISGTVLTFVADITCGSTASNMIRFAVRAADGHLIGRSNVDNKLRRYNASGTLQATETTATALNYQWWGFNILGAYFYTGDDDSASRLQYQACPLP